MRRNILVAEDNEVNQEVIAESIAKLGHDFTVVENGRAALEAALTGKYDLVLMDLRMPHMDGFEAARAIRQEEAIGGTGKRIPIVALSANAMKGDRDLCLDCGMDDHLAKPFTLDGLSAKLAQWLPRNADQADDAPRPAEASLRHAAADDSKAIIDETALKRISALQRPGRPNVLDKIIRTFFKTTPLALEQLDTALAAGEFAAARDLAHSLKSSAANLGALGMAEYCRELEALAGEQKLEAARAKLTEVEICYPAVKMQLERHLGRDAEVAVG